VISLFKQSDFQERGEKMEERLSALFELRVGEMREESERMRVEMESLRSIVARVESDNT